MACEADPLVERLRRRTAEIAVMGLGFAGLPIAVEFAKAGFRVTGLDIDDAKVRFLNSGKSPIPDVADSDVRVLVEENWFRASYNFNLLANVDVVVICVPTPLKSGNEPDLRFVQMAANSIRTHLHAGQLVVLQSTCAPGTTRHALLPILKSSGLRIGSDLCIAYAPERIDPGNQQYTVRNTPKLVGGITKRCTELAVFLFEQVVDQVVAVTTPEVAEMAKLIENSFRFVNIGFINEMAILCDRLNIDIWEVIDAASTKPFGFLPHYPSPGVGGHCVPVVPHFLAATADDNGMAIESIQTAGRINGKMPTFVVAKLRRILTQRGQALRDARVLLLGMAYKPNISDARESSSLLILSELLRRDVIVAYHDPYVPRVVCDGRELRSLSVAEVREREFDCAILLTAHADVDYQKLLSRISLVFDTRNYLHNMGAIEVVRL